MAVFTWTTDQGGFACTLNDPPQTIVDNVRVLIGDKGPKPIAYLSDAQIQNIANQHNQDLYMTTSECCRACATQCMQLWQEVQQGTRFRIKNFDLMKAYDNFITLADMYENRSLPTSTTNYGTLSGQIAPCATVSTTSGTQGYCGPRPLFGEW